VPPSFRSMNVSDADAALAFLRRLYERRAGRVEPLAFGIAIVTDELPLVRDLNFVLVDRWDRSGAELVAASEAAH
jgi:hypothetical protein